MNNREICELLVDVIKDKKGIDLNDIDNKIFYDVLDNLVKRLDSSEEDKRLFEYNESQFNRLFTYFTGLARLLQKEKGEKYKGSWCGNASGRGEIESILPNIERKIDRLKNIIKGRYANGYKEKIHDVSEIIKENETTLETAIDLGVYSFLYVSWISIVRPGEMVEFSSKYNNFKSEELL